LFTNRRISRRGFITGAGKAAFLGGLLGTGLLHTQLSPAAAQQPAGINSLVWVWKFSADGDLYEIRDTLAARRLGVLLKTHDGTNWMSQYDDSPHAVSGPEQIALLASIFEQAGVPFHAWCVVQGRDPIREAGMCAAVLNAGARSMFLDLEPSEGSNYWQGSAADAVTFGQELRRLAPNAWLAVAPDSRPWQVGAVPTAEFAEFSNAIAPQTYWETFQGPTNRKRFAEHGYFVGPEGVTPELVIDASVGTFRGFGRPIQPIGQGASAPDKWRRFIESARGHGIDSISLWRYGAAEQSAFDVLGEVAPAPLPPVVDAGEAPVDAGDAPVAAAPEGPELGLQMAAIQEPDSTSRDPEPRVKDEGDTSQASPAVAQSPRDAIQPFHRTLRDIKDRVVDGLGRRVLGFYR
jgi:hypothetical protein